MSERRRLENLSYYRQQQQQQQQQHIIRLAMGMVILRLGVIPPFGRLIQVLFVLSSPFLLPSFQSLRTNGRTWLLSREEVAGRMLVKGMLSELCMPANVNSCANILCSD